MSQQALAIHSVNMWVCVCVGTGKRGTVVTQHMEHEYLNILSNKIAVTPQCAVFFLSTSPLWPSSSLSFCSAYSLILRAKYTCHLCSGYNEAPLHTFKKLTEPFPRKYFIFSYLSFTSSFSPCPPPSLISFLALASSVSPANLLLFFLSPSPFLWAPAEPI